MISPYESFFYYLLIAIIIIFFLLSINFSLKNFINSIKKLITLFSKKNDKSYTNKDELINEFIPQEEIKDLIQEDLPFIRAGSKSSNKSKFLFPSIDLLKIPGKNERSENNNNENNNPEFLEKILLDFGVDGKIKLGSSGE